MCIETCSGVDRAKALFELAALYNPSLSTEKFNPDYPNIELNIDSTIAILKKAIEADSTYNNPIDYLGSIYYKKGEREKAIEYYLRSSNLSLKTRAGTWLALGDGVTQDLVRGVSILHDAADEVAKIDFYQGGYNPIWELNKLYYCSKLITKEDLKNHDMGYFHCDND